MAGKITALRIQKRRNDRVNVYIDEKYAFSLQLILAATLRRGQLLDDGEIKQLLQRDAAEKAYERSLHYLTFRPRSRAEIHRFLQGKEVPEEAIDQVLARLERAKLLDDVQFARFWVENRQAFRPRGAFGLKMELRNKGIDDAIIESAISEIDEETLALSAARRRAEQLAHLEKDVFHRRILSFLQRRGFRYDVSRHATDHLWEEVGQTEHMDE